MTRFEKEISGKLGEYWVKSAKAEVERMMVKASTEATVEEDGAIKWNSNGQYLPADCCEKLVYGGFDFDNEATATKRAEQTAKTIEQYRKARAEYGYSKEEIAEMRNAFGKGTVVDVFTGKRFKF